MHATLSRPCHSQDGGAGGGDSSRPKRMPRLAHSEGGVAYGQRRAPGNPTPTSPVGGWPMFTPKKISTEKNSQVSKRKPGANPAAVFALDYRRRRDSCAAHAS